MKSFLSNLVYGFSLMGISFFGGCRNRDFENQNLYSINKYPELVFENQQTSACSENNQLCRFFSVHFELKSNSQKPLKLHQKQVSWTHPQMADLKITSSDGFHFIAQGKLMIDPENPYFYFGSLFSVHFSSNNILHYRVTLAPQLPTFIISSTMVSEAFIPSIAENNLEKISVSEIKTLITSIEKLSAQREHFLIELDLHLTLNSQNIFGTRSVIITFLHPEKTALNLVTDENGHLKFPLDLVRHAYEHESFEEILLKIDFPKILGQKPLRVDLRFNLDRDLHDSLVGFNVGEYPTRQVVSLRKSASQKLLSIDIQNLFLEKVQTDGPLRDSSRRIGGSLRLTRIDRGRLLSKVLGDIILHGDLFHFEGAGPTPDLVARSDSQTTTDSSGNFRFDFIDNEPILTRIKEDARTILRITMPELPKAEKIYLLFNPLTDSFIRRSQDQVPVEIR